MQYFSIRTDEKAKKAEQDYIYSLQNMEDRELIAELFSYLDYTEESDSGRVFHPITISSCRVGLSPGLDMVLKHLRARADNK